MALTVMFQTNCDHVIKPSTIDYIHIVAVSVSFYVYLLIFGYEMNLTYKREVKQKPIF